MALLSNSSRTITPTPSANPDFAPEGALYLAWLHSRLLAIIASNWTAITLPVVIAIVGGLYVLTRQANAYAAQFACMVAIMAAANIQGHFPIMEERFGVFIVPWLALLAANGASVAIEPLKEARIRLAAKIGLTALMLLPALDTIRDPFHQQARRSLAHIRANPHIALVTSTAAEPVVDAYLAAPHRTNTSCAVVFASATTNRCTAAMSDGDGIFQGPATKWYLMNYIAAATWGGSDFGFPGKSVHQFSSDYYDWLVASLRRHDKAHLLILQGNKALLAAINARLQPNETLRLIVDERPPSPTLAHSAAQLYVYRKRSCLSPYDR